MKRKKAAAYDRGRTGSVYPFFRTSRMLSQPHTSVYPFCLPPQRRYLLWLCAGRVIVDPSPLLPFFLRFSFLGFIVLPLHCSWKLSVSYHSSCNRTCLLSTYDLLYFVSLFCRDDTWQLGTLLDWKVTPSSRHFVWMCLLGTPVESQPQPTSLAGQVEEHSVCPLVQGSQHVISSPKGVPWASLIGVCQKWCGQLDSGPWKQSRFFATGILKWTASNLLLPQHRFSLRHKALMDVQGCFSNHQQHKMHWTELEWMYF